MRFLINIILLSIGICIALVISEGICRVFFPIKISTFMRTKVENWLDVSPSLSLGYIINKEKNDSQNKRTYLKNNKTKKRIFCVGDSTTATSSYVNILQELLGKKYAVLNYGTPGYGIMQYCRLIKDRCLDKHPDIIIIGFCLNDFVTTPILVREGSRFTAYWPHKEIKPKASVFFLLHSALYRFLFLKLAFCKNENTYKDIIFQEAKKKLQEIKEEADRIDTRIILVIFGYPIPFDEYHPYYGKRSYDEIKRITKELKLESLNLVPNFTSLTSHDPDKLKVSPNDTIHFNKKGSKIIAQEIYKYLLDHPISDNHLPFSK